jgi:hypothetical protein
MWYLIINGALLLIGFIFNYLRLFRRLVYKKANKKGHVKERLNLFGICYLLFNVIGLIYGLYNVYLKGTEKDFIHDFISQIKTSKQRSLIEICSDTQEGVNPIFMPTNKPDSVMLKISICNKGNDIAFNLKDMGVTITDTNGHFILTSKNYPPALNAYSKIPPNELIPLYYPMKKFAHDGIGTDYFCFKLVYSDNEFAKDSIIEIYTINIHQPLDKQFVHPNSAYYPVIENFLKQQGIW